MPELWVRIGDSGNYESFGQDLSALIGELQEHRPGKVTGWRPGGVTTEHYAGQNYISLFWGNDEAEFSDDLNYKERADIIKALA